MILPALTLTAVMVVSMQVTPLVLPNPEVFATQTVAERREIMKRVVAAAADASTDSFGLIERGLVDGDSSVRRLASAAVGQLLMASSRRDRAALALGSVRDRVSLPTTLVTALSGCLSDEERAVRGNCLNALVYFWPGPASSLTARLLAAFDTEGDSVMRTLLLQHLRHVGDADSRVGLRAVAALEDPAADVRYQAALAVAAVTPPGGLEAAVAALRTGDVRTRPACVAAIAAYGAAALPYVETLEWVKQNEPSEPVRRQIEAAIEKIRTAH